MIGISYRKILEVVKKNNHDLIIVGVGSPFDTVIMGNVSRAGPNGLFIGNTAEKILCHSDISLLVVKPIAFLETPELRLTPSETVCAL